MNSNLTVGWAQADITPDRPVLIAGQFHARVSEGVADPITATVCALATGEDHAVLVSCDLVAVADELRDEVRRRAGAQLPDLNSMKIILSATHTHTAPETRSPSPGSAHTSSGVGVELDVMPTPEYVDFAAERISEAVVQAWRSKASAGFAFGLGYAVVGRNRRWVDTDGRSTMYGKTNTPAFSHIEGYEDHSVNLLATCGPAGEVTGLIVNVPSPSQVTESDFALSADYWHETRQELRRRFGKGLPVLAQCSAAGDQSPHLIYDKKGEARMLELRESSERQEIARRIADAVEAILPPARKSLERTPRLRHVAQTVELPTTSVTEADVAAALGEAANYEKQYEEEIRKLKESPELREQSRWYVPATRAYRRMRWFQRVQERFESQKTHPTLPVEIHVIRLGDVVFATNPFEYYLDHGIHIKARSAAVQTFLVQLSGSGTYVPSARSVSGGGYGSVPASNRIGPEGGRALAEQTIEIVEQLFAEAS